MEHLARLRAGCWQVIELGLSPPLYTLNANAANYSIYRLAHK